MRHHMHLSCRIKAEVWLVSDTLALHTDCNYYLKTCSTTKSTACKVVIQRGRLIFNAGAFSSIPNIEKEEKEIPLSGVKPTSVSNAHLQQKYCMEGYCLPNSFPERFQLTGVVEAIGGEYSGVKVDSSMNPDNPTGYIVPLDPGLADGYGDVIERVHKEARTDSVLRKKLAANPKEELLKILKEEADSDSKYTGPPFTVLVLHKDGTVSDYSQKHVCDIPADARATP